MNGHPAVVLGASYSLAPRRIVVLVDMSGSMGGSTDTSKWRIAREAVEDLLAQTPADVPIALLTFSDQVHEVFDFSQTRTTIAAWLKQGTSLRSNLKGRTALWDTVVAGLKLLQPARPGDAIYAITDGGDNVSHASGGRTKTALLESGVRLFAFLFAEPTMTPEERDGVDSLVEMASDTGGFVFGVPSHRALGGAALQPSWDFEYDYNDRTREKIKLYTQELAIQVNGFYTVQVTAPPTLGKAGKVSLEIVDAAGKARKDVGYTFQRVLLPLDK